MGPWAVEVVWAALGMEHPQGRVVVWRCWVGEVGVARGLLGGRHHGAWWCRMGGAVGETLAVCHRGQVMQGGAGTGGRRWYGSMARRAGRVATNQAGIGISYRHDGSKPGLAVIGL